MTGDRESWAFCPGQPQSESQIVTLVLDATARIAIAACADEREGHIREVERHGQTFHEGPYGRRNHQDIVARETRIAASLRAAEQVYRIVIECDVVFRPFEPTKQRRLPEHAADGKPELSKHPADTY